MSKRSAPDCPPDTFLEGVKYALEKLGKANIILDPENYRFEAKRCFSCSPNWLRKIVNISNNSTLDGLYGFVARDQPKISLLS